MNNVTSSKGYAILRLMTGSGIHLMGDRRSPGLLPRAFAAARARADDVRDGAIYRELMRQLARHGRDLHAANVLMSDIKPANILFRRGHVEFSDFGTAVRGPEAQYRGGTWAYRAPESFLTNRVRPACDVYALGITLAEWILGKHPLRIGPSSSDYMKVEDFAEYIAGRACPHAALLDRRFARIGQVDAELGQLVRRMIGVECGRPSFAEVVASPALALSPSEREVMDAAYTSLPKHLLPVRRRLWELEAEVERLGLPYRRDDRTWQP